MKPIKGEPACPRLPSGRTFREANRMARKGERGECLECDRLRDGEDGLCMFCRGENAERS